MADTAVPSAKRVCTADSEAHSSVPQDGASSTQEASEGQVERPSQGKDTRHTGIVGPPRHCLRLGLLSLEIRSHVSSSACSRRTRTMRTEVPGSSVEPSLTAVDLIDKTTHKPCNIREMIHECSPATLPPTRSLVFGRPEPCVQLRLHERQHICFLSLKVSCADVAVPRLLRFSISAPSVTSARTHTAVAIELHPLYTAKGPNQAHSR